MLSLCPARPNKEAKMSALPSPVPCLACRSAFQQVPGPVGSVHMSFVVAEVDRGQFRNNGGRACLTLPRSESIEVAAAEDVVTPRAHRQV